MKGGEGGGGGRGRDTSQVFINVDVRVNLLPQNDSSALRRHTKRRNAQEKPERGGGRYVERRAGRITCFTRQNTKTVPSLLLLYR